MDFVTALKTCLRKYATFSGRASRSEFWYFMLFTWLVSLVAMVLDQSFFGGGTAENPVMPLTSILQFATALPVLAVSARRLHDVGRSGWWFVISFTVIGLIPLLYWYVKKGTDGDNAYAMA